MTWGGFFGRGFDIPQNSQKCTINGQCTNFILFDVAL